MIENVRWLLQRRFDGYRAEILSELDQIGYLVVNHLRSGSIARVDGRTWLEWRRGMGREHNRSRTNFGWWIKAPQQPIRPGSRLLRTHYTRGDDEAWFGGLPLQSGHEIDHSLWCSSGPPCRRRV